MDDDEETSGGSGKKERLPPSCACAPGSDGSDTAFDQLAARLQAQIDALEGEYFSPGVVRECKYPHNLGRMENPDATAKVGTVGESIELFLKFDDEGKVSEALFATDGCGSTIASGSMLTRMVKGKTPDMLERLTVEDLMAALGGMPPAQKHCAELAMEALAAAIGNSRR
jgi:nitrogen fixation NifU-like protein